MKYLLIDGSNLAHIAFHKAKSVVSKENSELSDIKGMMFLIFFRKLHKFYKKFKGYNFVIAWDNSGSSKWRREIFPEYKSGRNYDNDPVWDILFTGIDSLKEVLTNYPIYQLCVSKLEADDILYVLAGKLSAKGEVIVLSTDADLIQIAQEFGKNVKLFHPIKDVYVTIPKNYDIIYYKALMGDKSDDIPGVPSFGKKKSERAAVKIKNGESVENVLIEATSKRLSLGESQELLQNNIDIINRNVILIDIKNNPNLKDVKYNIDEIENSKIDFSKIKKFYFDNKLKSLIESFDNITNLFI